MSDFARRTTRKAAMTLGVPLLVCAPLCNTLYISRALASSGDGAPSKHTSRGLPTTANSKSGQPRLISLAPSNTELLCTIGARGEIIGICSFCDYPGDVSQIGKVGTFVSANMERLSRLKPDYILLVSGQEMLASQLAHNKFKTIVLDNSHLANISSNLKKLGQISGKTAEAERSAAGFEQALTALGRILPKAGEAGAKKPSVFYCVWPQPLMTAGRDSFLNEVITTCGGSNIAGSVPASYPRYSMEQLVLKNPDVIILPYEARGQSFLERAPWTMLKAVKEKRVYYLPDQKHDTLSRPTIRVLEGISWLAEILHPEKAAELGAWRAGEYYQSANH